MDLSIIICTYNRSFLLSKLLDSILNLKKSSMSHELIIVDNNSSDNTLDICNKYNSRLNQRYFFEKNQGILFARRNGILKSKGRYVIFIDDDFTLEKDFLIEIENIISNHPEINILGCEVRIKSNFKLNNKFKETFGHRNYGKGLFLLKEQPLGTGGLFIKKELIYESGWLSKALILSRVGKNFKSGEDKELISRLKKIENNFWYSSKIIVNHFISEERSDLISICKLNYNFGLVNPIFSKMNNKYRLIRFILFFKTCYGIFVLLKQIYFQNIFKLKSIDYTHIIGLSYYLGSIKTIITYPIEKLEY